MCKFIITNSDSLYRRIPKNDPNFWKEINGVRFLSSAGFKTKKNEDELSVDIVALTTPAKSIANYPDNILAEFSASIPLNEGYECIHKPSKRSKNKAHAIIVGDTKPISKKLAIAASIL